MRLKLLLFLLLFCGQQLWAQDSNRIGLLHPAEDFNPTRLKIIVGTEVISYAGIMIGLNALWYADYPRSNFHFFNDNKGWKQMDKVGHFYTSYVVGEFGAEVLKWTGTKTKRSIIYGGLLGSAFLTTIEILDGFSAQWGASPSDLLANTSGSFLFIAQELAWNEQKVRLKYSFWPQHYTPDIRWRADELYGSSLQEQFIKDYNGQTYWASFNIKSIGNISKFPAWLNIAVGYGANGMLGAEKNLITESSSFYTEDPSLRARTESRLLAVSRTRQYYISPDIDLSKIKTNSRFLKLALGFLNYIKFPAPALLLENGQIKILPIYF